MLHIIFKHAIVTPEFEKKLFRIPSHLKSVRLKNKVNISEYIKLLRFLYTLYEVCSRSNDDGTNKLQ